MNLKDAQSSPVVATESITLPHPATDLWPFVADANRMDRAVGLPPAAFQRLPRPEGGELVIGEYRRLGMLYARWREFPFEWQRPKYYTVLREYDYGPITRFFGGVRLEERSDGTKVTVFGEFNPRWRLVRPWISLWLAPRTTRKAIRQYQDISEFLSGRHFDPFPSLGPDVGDLRTESIESCLARLNDSGGSQSVAERIRRMIMESGDEAVAGMRPLELAREWGTDETETVQTFLKATVEGLLEMRWEFLCPSCRGVKADAARLRDLEVTGYCAACNLPFAASVDEGIEARFYPSSAVRDLRIGTYCIGNPMNTPHRLAQSTLLPNERRSWQLDLVDGPYIVRSPQSKGVARVTARTDTDPKEPGLQIHRDHMEPARIEVRSGEVSLRLANEVDSDVTIAIDDAHWSDTATTPSKTLLVPGFNALFSGEALAPGVELAVTRIGLLFSDLAGSTALYERAGEANAFRLVSNHFALVQRAIDHAGGTTVKTIGDAVMGAFPDGLSAIRAATEVQRAMFEFDTGGLADPSRLLKVGVHAGPAYLVTLNDRLDYFGTTVNIAARAQREAHGGEIVTSAAVLDDAGAHLDRENLEMDPFSISLRGLSTPIRLVRIRLRGHSSDDKAEIRRESDAVTE